MPKFSIVIPTFNSSGFISSCLDSVYSQKGNNFETIVVDNGSRDGTVEKITRFYPEITLIKNKENLGASKARNQGITISKGEWILTLDCDVVLEKHFLRKIFEFINVTDKRTGIIQPKIIRSDEKSIYSCGIKLTKFRRFYDIGRKHNSGDNFNRTAYIFGACAAAACYRREMLEDVKEISGYFDERFFFLAEDVDLSWRAQKKGWNAVFFPSPLCYHFGNSSGLDEQIRRFLCFRNRYHMIIKNEGFLAYSKRLLPLFLYDLPRLFYLVLTNRYVWKYLLVNKPDYSLRRPH